jgi:hypothetical protein
MKGKTTLSIDKKVLSEAQKEAEDKRIPLSRAVENFLNFFANPYIYCFSCGEKFAAKKAEVCTKCGWLICPSCKACRCKLNEKEAVTAFHMRKVYEDLLSGRIK